MQVENLILNEFMTNLGTDWVAVDPNGHPVGRASTEAAIRQAVPDAAHYLSARDLLTEHNLEHATVRIKDPEPPITSGDINANLDEISAAIDTAPVEEPVAEEPKPAAKKTAAKK